MQTFTPYQFQPGKPTQASAYGKATPADNYGSGIATDSPFTQSSMMQTAATPQAYTGKNQSRNVFSRALSDASRADINNQYAKAGQEYQQKGEEARSQDVQAQRKNAVDRYSMNQERIVTQRKQDVQLDQDLKNFENYRQQALKNSEVNTLTNMANTIIGAGLAVMSPGVGGLRGITGMMTNGGTTSVFPRMQSETGGSIARSLRS
jgi:hypothetical protein